MNKTFTLLPIFLIVSSILLIACGETTTTTVKTNRTDRRPPAVSVKPDEEILPILQVNEKGTVSKMVLRSQTSHFLNAEKSALEIKLTSSNIAFCKNEQPTLKEGESEIILTIKAKDPKKALTKGEFAKNPDYEISAKRKTSSGSIDLPSSTIQSFKISDLNSAIVRGSFSISSPNLIIAGEYFTAVCK